MRGCPRFTQLGAPKPPGTEVAQALLVCLQALMVPMHSGLWGHCTCCLDAQLGLCNHKNNRTLMWQLQCHDEVPFLACRRFSLPGLLTWYSLWESRLLLTWLVYFGLGLLPFHRNISRSCQPAPLLNWSETSSGRPQEGRFFCLITARALLSVMSTSLNLPGSL